MRRALRHAFTLLSVLSLLLCVAVCGLWVRSYQAHDAWYSTPRTPPASELAPQPGHPDDWIYQYRVGTQPGRVQLVRYHIPVFNAFRPGYQPGATRWEVSQAPRSHGFEFQWSRRRFRFAGPYQDLAWGIRLLTLPLWFVAVVLFIMPATRLRAALKRRHADRSGLCPACGYDLRATPGRCPECGAGGGGGPS